MPLPPPPPPSSGGSSGGGGGSSSGGGGGGSSSGGSSGGGGRTTEVSPSSSPKHNPWVVFEDGHIKFVSGVNPPKNALTSFGLSIKRSDWLQAQSHYNDLFKSWLGRGVKKDELAHIIRRGVSDFSLQMHFTHLKGFKHSAVYKSYETQANQALGFKYKLKPREIRQTLLGGGDLQGALAQSKRAQRATVHSFRTAGDYKQAQSLLGAFGSSPLNNRETRALALNESGLVKSNLGVRLDNAVQQALQKYQRIFGGNLATPSVSLGSGGLSAPSLLGQKQEPDVAA